MDRDAADEEDDADVRHLLMVRQLCFALCSAGQIIHGRTIVSVCLQEAEAS